jgi:hypothetical protein
MAKGNPANAVIKSGALTGALKSKNSNTAIPEGIILKPCCNCGRPIKDGYFGAWADAGGGVCSKTCNDAYDKKRPKLLDYSIPEDLYTA